MEELFRRLETRNRESSGETFVIPREEMEKYVSLFEPPHPDERDEEAPAPSKLAK